MDGLLIAPVDDALGKRIASAQDGKGPSFTIAIDGAAPETLAVSPERLRDYQNVYYRVTGQAGAWRLEERGFSASGEDAESKLIRRALGVPEDRKVFFLPGRRHLVIPAARMVVLQADGKTWRFGKQSGTVAVLLRGGQSVPLRLNAAVSTASAKPGAPLALSVAEDVLAEGAVAIAAGSPVEGRVVRVVRPDILGAPAGLAIELGQVKAVDGTAIPLQGESGARLSFEGRPAFFLCFRARNLELAPGTKIAAQVASAEAILAPAP